MSLSLSKIVDVNISISPLSQQLAGFGLINIIGTTNVISTTERFRLYSSIDGVADDFDSADEEYKAATIVFSQIPRPSQIIISRRDPVEAIQDELDAIQDKTDASSTLDDDWYHFMFTSEVRDSQDARDAAAWAEARTKIFWNNSSDIVVKDGAQSTDIASYLQAQGYSRSVTVYDNDDDYPANSAAARISTVDYSANNASITLAFKQLPGISPTNLTETEAASIEGKNANYYSYFSDSRMFWEGKTASGRFIDEVINLDALKNALQVSAFNYLYQSPTKIPQTNAGVSGIVQVCENVCEQFVYNGVLSPGSVTVDNQSFYLEKGYQVTAQRVEAQNQADREARKCPPIEVLVKGAGAIHRITLNATFTR